MMTQPATRRPKPLPCLCRILTLAELLLWCMGAQAGRHAIAFFVAPDGTQGVVRIVNGADEAGTVTIHAIDDAGVR